MADLIDLSLDHGIARITLDRPDAANTIDLALARQFLDIVAALEESAPRAVVIAGRGRAFCAGGDVKAMAKASDLGTYLDRLVTTFHEALRRLGALDAVLIAAVHGAAAGGGLGLALNADVRIATPEAKFLTAYEAVGLTPDSGVSYLLPRVIGIGRATAMSASGRQVDAEQALSFGLVTEVVPAEDLASRIDALAGAAAARPQSHMSSTRRLLRGDADGAYARALDAERAALVAAASASTEELIRAFAGRDAKKETA